jgi:DNA-directed RNA polymerase specialized sigma24 family protein
MANDEPQHTPPRSNSPQTFGPLYEQYYSQIFGYVYRRILHWETAQDITAEVFLKAYKSFWRFRWSSIPIGAWFYRIATNEVNMYFRLGRFKRDVSLTELLEEKGSTRPTQPRRTPKRSTPNGSCNGLKTSFWFRRV